jgi:hypothetical protein
LVWASDRAGLAGSSPAHEGLAGPSPKNIKNKKNKKIKNRKIEKYVYACIKNNINLLVYHQRQSRE